MTRGRIAALSVVALLMSGCGGGGEDAAPRDEAETTSTVDRPANAGTARKHPCDLVTREQVSELFGEPAAEPDRVTDPIEECVWVVQASIDDPSLDNAGKQLSLGYSVPPSGFESSEREYFELLLSGSEPVDGFGDAAFVLGGQLYVLKGEVVLVAMAGLSDDASAITARDGLMHAALDAL